MAQAPNLAPPDPNVKMPPGALAAAQRAEELMKTQQVHRPGEPDAPPPPEPGKDDAPPPVPAQDATPPAEAREEAPPPPVEPRPDEGAPPAQVDEDSWEKRYKAGEGRFKAREREVAALNAKVAKLEALVETLQAPPPAAGTEVDVESYITPEEQKDYGDEFLGVVAKKARQIAAPLQKEVEDLKRQLSSLAKGTEINERQRMFETLDASIPNWRQINHDENFKEWLGQLDPYSGQLRQDMLKSADAQNNAARVAAFFEGFLREAAAVAPRDPVEPRSESRAPAPPKPSLDEFAAPGRAKSTSAPKSPGPEQQPPITRAFIAQFFAERRQGKYRGREAEADKIEKSIFDAQAAGRIT